MKDKKRRLETFSFYDHTGIEKHLEEMAANGWRLSKINHFTWEYSRAEKKKLKYAVTYYPNASEFDPEPQEGQLVYRELSKKSGWKFICASAQMQIFCNEKENPVPMETDPELEIEVIHKAAKRSFLPANFLLLIVSVLQAAIFITTLIGDPVGVLSSGSRFATGFCWALVFILCIIELGGYYLWRHAALRVASYGDFLDTKSHAKILKIALVMTILAALYIAINLFSIGNKMMFTIYLSVMFCLIGLFFIVSSIKQLLKRKKASRNVNMTITLSVDFVLAFAFVFGITFAGFRIARQDMFEMNPDTKILYQVNIPLAVEDLQDAGNAEYIKENTQDESVLLGQRQVWQYPKNIEKGGHRVPGLNYELTNS